MSRRWSWRLVFIPALLGATAVQAQGQDAFYQATTIVTGTDMRSRPSGFAECLREVMVKVSGDPRLWDSPAVRDLASHADALITSFGYIDPRAGIRPHDDQGTYDRSYDLTVRFDPAKIDAALAGLGQLPWRGARPVVVPVLAVHGFAVPYTRSYLLTAEEPAAAAQRGSFANSAQKFGMRVRIPSAAEMAAWKIGVDHVALPSDEAPGEQPVAGTLEFRDGIGWVGAWHMRWQGNDVAWGVRGVSFDAAFDSLVGGVARIASGHGPPD